MGAVSVLFRSQVSLRFTTAREMKYTSQHCCDKAKQWMAKWPCITNAVFRILQNHGE